MLFIVLYILTDDGVSVSVRLSLRLDVVHLHRCHGLRCRMSTHHAYRFVSDSVLCSHGV